MRLYATTSASVLFLCSVGVVDRVTLMAGASKRQQWQAHVDDALLRTGQVQRAAIFGLDGKEWATSSGFQVRIYSECTQLYLLYGYTFIYSIV